jgi:thiamine biosynthesis lipoprotein
MASPLRLTIATAGLPDDVAELLADAAWTIVRGTFEVAETAMSRFREDSELTGLNRRSPGSASVSRPLERALSAADRAHRVTGGRFDPRIVSALERIGYAGVAQGHVAPPRPPGSTERILDRKGRTGRVALRRQVDLGGIGKGLALRWAANALEASLGGSTDPPLAYLIDAGGDIVGSGSPGAGEPWRVGIEDPSDGPDLAAAAAVAVVAIAGRSSVATSSVRRLRWEHDGRVVHHLIDPRTGEPGGDGMLAVTVAGPDPAWAEVWSKALFLEGAGGIADLARGRGLAAWWVTSEGGLEMTAAARVRTVWVASEA